MELADKLVLAYRRIRDAKYALVAKHKEEVGKLDEQLDVIEKQLLEICKETGQTGGKTEHGSFSRRVSNRYWTNNWPALYSLINEQHVPEILEQRIHQSNFAQFITEHPELLPEGMSVESRYTIVVTKPKTPVV